MAFSNTTNLRLPIITTGTELVTWGNITNNALTEYIDISIAGGLAISIAGIGTVVTLTKTDGAAAGTNIGATTAQYAILNISGVKTGACTLNLPITSKWYIIINAGTGGFLLTVRGVTPTTGVTLVDNEKCIVAWNGSDFVKVASTEITALSGTLGTANGGTGSTSTTYASLTANVTGTLPVANGGTGVTASTGTGSVMLNINPTLTNYVESVVAIGNSGATQTLALTNGTFQTVTMTGNCTFTMPAVVGGKSFTLTINTGTGSFTATFTSVKFPGGTAPTLTTTASRFDVFTFFSDGTSWYGNAAQNFV